MSAYCASKFAVRGFSESLAVEMLTTGNPVKVTVVHPGGVKTNIATAAFSEAQQAGLATPEHERRTRTYNEKLLKMPPPQAAKIILDGVDAGKSRVLVGNDAKLVDLLVRLLPRWYTAHTGAAGRSAAAVLITAGSLALRASGSSHAQNDFAFSCPVLQRGDRRTGLLQRKHLRIRWGEPAGGQQLLQPRPLLG